MVQRQVYIRIHLYPCISYLILLNNTLSICTLLENFFGSIDFEFDKDFKCRINRMSGGMEFTK